MLEEAAAGAGARSTSSDGSMKMSELPRARSGRWSGYRTGSVHCGITARPRTASGVAVPCMLCIRGCVGACLSGSWCVSGWLPLLSIPSELGKWGEGRTHSRAALPLCSPWPSHPSATTPGALLHTLICHLSSCMGLLCYLICHLRSSSMDRAFSSNNSSQLRSFGSTSMDRWDSQVRGD